MFDFLKKQIKRAIYKSSKDAHLLSRDLPKKIVLINTPVHGNIGDQALALAEKKFLQTQLNDYYITEITQSDFIVAKNEILREIKPNDIIAMQGGGSIGTLYPWEHDTIIEMIKCFHKNKIVIFPQTLFFDKGRTFDNQLFQDFICLINSCSDISILLRDRASFDILAAAKLSKNVNIDLVPDIATYLSPLKNKRNSPKDVLLCFRNDNEKVQLFDEHEVLKECLKDFNVHYTDTSVNVHVFKKVRPIIVYWKIMQFSNYKLIITDRIHGMIFAALANVPCIAIDNISKKVSGQYEWIKYLEYIKFASSSEEMCGYIEEFLGLSSLHNYSYSNEPLAKYYKRVKRYFTEGEMM